MQRWEYLAIRGFAISESNYPTAYLYTEQGAQVLTEFKNRPRGVSEVDAVAAYIAKLGNEGWEMVQGYAGDTTAMRSAWLFKRPKEWTAQ